MSVETHRVLLGACGWKHSGWSSNYYSEELPEEWQLGFYSNEFSVVYVPAKDWLAAADLTDWQENVSAVFRFILEVPEHTLENEQDFIAMLDKAKILGELCLGLVLKLPQSLSADAVLLQKRLRMAQAVTRVCVDAGVAVLSIECKTLLVKQNITQVWDGISTEKAGNLKGGRLAICCLSGEALDLQNLRKIIEVCLSVSSENCVSVLCFDGNPPSLELLRNAGIILDLL